jgi:hypothetical protein
MPNYFYVKNGGTAAGSAVDSADGVYSSKKTGAWSTAFSSDDYFDSIADACDSGNSVTPTTGDFIVVSDAHNKTHTTAITWLNINLPNSNTTHPLTFISVDDGEVQTYKPATSFQEYVSNNQDLNFLGSSADDSKVVFYGLYFGASDDTILVTSAADCDIRFYDCTFGGGDAGGDNALTGAAAAFYGCTFRADTNADSRYLFNISGVTGFEFYNCKFESDISGVKGYPIIQAATTATYYFQDCDMTQSKSAEIFDTSTSTDKQFALRMVNCALPSELTAYNGTVEQVGDGFGIEAVGCSSTAAGAEYAYYREFCSCTAESTTAAYRDNSEAYPSGAQVSYKVDTAASTCPQRPFSFLLPTIYAEFSNAASDTMTVYLMSSTSDLTDEDVWVELSYPDGTNKHVRNLALSNPSRNPLGATGTALTSDTSTWTGRTTETRYKIDIATSGDAGADGVPTIRVFVARSSVTVYFCSTPELS